MPEKSKCRRFGNKEENDPKNEILERSDARVFEADRVKEQICGVRRVN